MNDLSDKTLTAAIEHLRSDDVQLQNEGVAAIVKIGVAAVPAVMPLLKDADSGRRAQVMYALAQIADPDSAHVFQQRLLDEDERVRAYAAQGLARIRHPAALEASLNTLNDAPDKLHNDITPAVQTLGTMGLRAVPGLLNLLASDDRMTRLRAQRALEMIVDQRYGSQPGTGFPTLEAENDARADWREHGNYSFDAEPAARSAAIEALRRWLDTLRE
jgi:HEAT repeat protein